MAKNFFKTFFNPNKDKSTNNSKISKLNPTYKLSELIKNNENVPDDSKILQKQQPVDSYNLLLNYYSKKDDKNNIINDFMEKISKLNKKFYNCSEKFIITKASFDKLSHELYLNLFKQIDCYVEEIQRLNKKLISIDVNDCKIEIRKLKKELNDNKQKVRNYEVKLKEKSSNEEKLVKEIESYKRRIIFFKNKININLMARNAKRIANVKKYYQENNDISNSMINKNASKNSCIRSKGYTYSSKNKNRKCFSPSPEKSSKYSNHNKNESFASSNKTINLLSQQKDQTNKRNMVLYNITMNNTISNFNKKVKNNDEPIITSNKSIIAINNENKYKEIFSDGELEGSNKYIIKINRKNKPKESIIVPFNKNYNKDDENTINNSSLNSIKNNIKNFDDINNSLNINKEKKEIEFKMKNDSVENINKHSPGVKKLDKFFEKFTESNSICDDKEENNKITKKEIKSQKTNKKPEKINKMYNSTLDIKNSLKTEKKKKGIIDSSKNSNFKKKEFKTNTNKKTLPIKKIINLPKKKFIKSSLNNNKINANDSNTNQNNNNNNPLYNLQNEISGDVKNKEIDNKIIMNNTFENNNILKCINNNEIINNNLDNDEFINKTMANEEQEKYRIIKSKTVKFKENEVSEKEHKLHFETSESENNDNENIDISSKDISINSFSNKRNDCVIRNKTASNYSENISDTLSKENHTEILSNDENSLILKKQKKTTNKKKNIVNGKNLKNIYKNPYMGKPAIKVSKEKTKLNKLNNEKEIEINKILREMNDDYNNELDMLKTQEEQIKLMLNLIDLNDI